MHRPYMYYDAEFCGLRSNGIIISRDYQKSGSAWGPTPLDLWLTL